MYIFKELVPATSCMYPHVFTDPSMNLGIQTAKSYFSNGKLYFNGKTQIGVCNNGLVL